MAMNDAKRRKPMHRAQQTGHMSGDFGRIEWARSGRIA